jgi:hypothetical protein
MKKTRICTTSLDLSRVPSILNSKEQIYGKCLITLSRFALLLALQLSACSGSYRTSDANNTHREKFYKFAQFNVICLGIFDKSGLFAALSKPFNAHHL